ncbi:hypothetical protein O9X81_05365 [Agrobacterium salinitolerans]|uniref:hypothetical protein n=1 Tax=Agrobacterium salinitolerans TaxID=1183413 RepID=UPI0022B85168|nr:hypothetical protein [Agrobacterium salinitolerans]MCZ7856035.1 hypothetical protein [Agrobacterium salinitolerans]
MLNAEIRKAPLKRLGYVVAYHEARAKDGIDRRRHAAIAKEYRAIITSLFIERMNSGEYSDA